MAVLSRSDRFAVPRTPLFAGCSDRERRALGRLGTTVSVDAGTVLTPEGKPGVEFFVVDGGVATCSVRGIPRAKFEEGDFFGEMALLDGGARTATVTADTDMRVVVFTACEFQAMLNTSVRVSHALLLEMARRLRAADSAA